MAGRDNTMSELNLAVPFLTHVRRTANHLPELRTPMKKVNKLLRDYAEKRRTLTLDALTVLDVCDNKGELHHELIDFIKQLPSKKNYKQSQTSNIRRLVRGIINGSLERVELGGDGGWGEGVVVSNLPTFLRTVWPLLPKSGFIDLNRGGVGRDDERRLSLPLSSWSERLLKSMIKVATEKGVDTLPALLLEHRTDVLGGMMEGLHSRRWKLAQRFLWAICVKLGITKPRGRAVYPKGLDQLPAKLRAEVQYFVDWAPLGIGSIPHLVSLAAQYGVRTKPFRGSSVQNYVRAICHAFNFITWSEDIGIEDLLELQPTTRIINGRTFKGFYNPYVEPFRETERDKANRWKRKGMDSVTFQRFFNAVCAIAAYSGVFELRTSFKQLYRPRVDKPTRAENKEQKKKTFDLEWVDGQIESLGGEVSRIIRDKTYVLTAEGRDDKETMSNLRKCTFYVIFVTLRYTAFRQQCVRNCVFGENIIFNPDGSVTFRYPKKIIKNSRDIDTTYSYADHAETHGILLDALNEYREVYEYAVEIFGGGMEGQFFGRVVGGTIKRYQSASELTEDFEAWGLAFFDFGWQMLKEEINLNPHFLRGLAIDWMYDKLGMSKEDIAKAVGCTVRVVEQDYMRWEKKIDAGRVLAEVNKNIRRAKQEEAEGSGREAKDTGIELMAKRLAASRAETARAKERAMRAEEKVKVLESKLRERGEDVAAS